MYCGTEVRIHLEKIDFFCSPNIYFLITRLHIVYWKPTVVYNFSKLKLSCRRGVYICINGSRATDVCLAAIKTPHITFSFMQIARMNTKRNIDGIYWWNFIIEICKLRWFTKFLIVCCLQRWLISRKINPQIAAYIYARECTRSYKR